MTSLAESPYVELESHTSPDGCFTLQVWRDGDGDLIIGLVGCEWHTHGDILASQYGGTPDSATRKYVDQVIGSQRAIVIHRVHGVLRWATISESDLYGHENDTDMKYAEPGETIERRYWNGEPVES